MADSLKEAQQKAQTKVHTPGETVSPSRFGSDAKFGDSRKPRLTTVALLFIAGALALISLWINRPGQQDQFAGTAAPVSTMQNITPSVPLPEEAPKSSGLVLKGVVVGGDVSYAMVNEEILSVGDSLGDYRVSSIQDTYIVVQDGSGASKRLKLPHEDLPAN